MGEGKCTFGVKMPMNLDMLNEIIYREVKHFRNYSTYTPNFDSNPVAGKFYAAHDTVKMESPEQEEKVAKYKDSITNTRRRGPHAKYPQPATENQVYGWYKPIMMMDRNDYRFYMPKRESERTKIEVLIRTFNPKTKKI